MEHTYTASWTGLSMVMEHTYTASWTGLSMVLVKRCCPVVSLSKSWVWCVSTIEPEISRTAVPARMKHGARM